ncbi:hypothetical protein FGB62_388g01 [Gracilaria domingensis]|nr:hypothetical protein FGB62_388g01 [Gracilaria domingensis]
MKLSDAANRTVLFLVALISLTNAVFGEDCPDVCLPEPAAKRICEKAGCVTVPCEGPGEVSRMSCAPPCGFSIEVTSTNSLAIECTCINFTDTIDGDFDANCLLSCIQASQTSIEAACRGEDLSEFEATFDEIASPCCTDTCGGVVYFSDEIGRCCFLPA